MLLRGGAGEESRLKTKHSCSPLDRERGTMHSEFQNTYVDKRTAHQVRSREVQTELAYVLPDLRQADWTDTARPIEIYGYEPGVLEAAVS